MSSDPGEAGQSGYPEVETMTDCLECGAELRLARSVEIGEIIDCDACGAELEVIGVGPLVVERAPEMREDWGE